MSLSTPSFVLSSVECLNLSKSSNPIATGIGYFDHMLDQLNSHAQIGVAVTVQTAVDHSDITGDKNRLALQDQGALMGQVGAALGKKLATLLQQVPAGAMSRFCCPLDEALVECILTVPTTQEEEQHGTLSSFTLPPYGVYPTPTGRTKIGQMETRHIQTFFAQVAQNMGIQVQLNKVRGDNGHHVVESAFKAFSRALRNLLDGTDTTISNGDVWTDAMEKMWGPSSESHQASFALERTGLVDRTTKETSIRVQLDLDGGQNGFCVKTGICTLDEFFITLAQNALVSLNINCFGDLWVDDHHTSEDVSIALGQVLNKALGTKAGLNRMWCAVGKSGDAKVEVTMDLSNRPCLTHNLSLANNAGNEEYVGDLSVEMIQHVLDSLVMNGQMTIHVVERSAGATVKDTAMATAVAFGKALRLCAAVDPRRAGKTASSKGTLSV